MRIMILFLVSCLVLAGCATTPQVNEEIPWQQLKTQIPPNNSLLYVVRPQCLSGSGNRYKIIINGTHIAIMPTGKYFSYLVPSGEVHVSAETVPNIFNFGFALVFMGKPVLTLTTTPGEIYFVKVGVDYAGGPTLTSVESRMGESLIKETKKMETLQK